MGLAAALAVAFVVGLPARAAAQVRHLASMTAADAAALDRAKTTKTFQRFTAVMDDSLVDVPLDAASRRAEAERAARQQRWLETHGR